MEGSARDVLRDDVDMVVGLDGIIDRDDVRVVKHLE